MNRRIRINGNLYEAVGPTFSSNPKSRDELANSIDALIALLSDPQVRKNCELSGVASGLVSKSTKSLEQLADLLRG